MAKNKTESSEIAVAEEVVINRIYIIRGQKVMLDRDLAMLYGVETRILNQAVKRNIVRFPQDFKFELTESEFESLRSQIVTLKTRGAHTKYLPSVFTEQGVAMLSSVLRSPQAIQVNIQIMRVFTKIRQMLTDNEGLKLEIEKIKRKLDNQDKNTELIFQYLDELNDKIKRPPLLPDRERVGYKIKGEEK